MTDVTDISVAIIHPGDRVDKMAVPLQVSRLSVTVAPAQPYRSDIVIADNADTNLGWEVLKRPFHDASLVYRMRGDVFHELDLWDMHPVKKWVARNVVLPHVDGVISITDQLAAKYQRETGVGLVGSAGLWIRPSEWPDVTHTDRELRAITLTNPNYWRKVRVCVRWAQTVDDALSEVGGHWHICGDGTHEDRLRDALADYENVHFVGYVDAAAKLAESNIMLHPTELDALPNAVLEGMASNLPVVTNDWPEFTTYGGPVACQYDLGQLRETLTDYADPERRATHGAAAWEYVANNHHPEHIATDYERFCQRVVADG